MFEELRESLEKYPEFLSRTRSRVVDADKGGEHEDSIEISVK